MMKIRIVIVSLFAAAALGAALPASALVVHPHHHHPVMKPDPILCCED